MDGSNFWIYPSPENSGGPTSPSLASVAYGTPEGSGSQVEVGLTLTPLEEEVPDDATVSLAFSPSLRIDGLLPDSIIVSSNHVYFYIHRHRILDVSSNAFFGHFTYEDLFPTPSLPTVHLPEDGDVVNVLLHTIYGLPCTHFHPSLETVEQSLTALIKYGILIEAHTTPHQPLYQLILSHAPHRPIDTYALAAHHDLEDLAVAASGHLLSYDTSRLTDDLAARIGPVYLKRLFLLHSSRLSALRNIILKPPETHPATPGCADGEQDELLRAWALAAAGLVWDATPTAWCVVGISPAALRVQFEPIGQEIVCEACRLMLLQRIQDVVISWSSVKATI
ncbi:hypothetical protein GSI_03817 [Ganoderma sinense ZZ0214-1]|uniref:BTB domain-containing protein n=1 Tax=Ganoderma sinense ZZ0214-1 TaxID=1077348 RepID=A0A2G8SK19_9APHY|nr:hypothetical protein GSI_03817 [Ganoderma sinense ZZ0214-1]